MYVHGVNDFRQTQIHTAKPLQPKQNTFEAELPFEKLKCHKSPGIDKIPPELIMTGGRTIRYDIQKLIISI